MKKMLFETLIMASANTYAGFYSGNRLLEELQSTDPVQHSYGVTYVLGVADIEELHVAQDSGKKRLSKAFFCLPGGVSSKQLSDVVRPFIENRPTVRHYNASFLVRSALIEAWQRAEVNLPGPRAPALAHLPISPSTFTSTSSPRKKYV